MATVFPEAVTLVREARQGLSQGPAAAASFPSALRAARPCAMTSLKERIRNTHTSAANPSRT